MGVRARGPLDVDALGRALSLVVSRHEVLRTVFAADGGDPVAVVRPATPLRPDVTDARRRGRGARPGRGGRRTPLRPGPRPLLRARVLRLAPEDHAVLITAHHAVTDGWSHAVFWGELAEAYRAELAGQDADLPDLPVQYGDFAVWQQGAGSPAPNGSGTWPTGGPGSPDCAPWNSRWTGPGPRSPDRRAPPSPGSCPRTWSGPPAPSATPRAPPST